MCVLIRSGHDGVVTICGPIRNRDGVSRYDFFSPRYLATDIKPTFPIRYLIQTTAIGY